MAIADLLLGNPAPQAVYLFPTPTGMSFPDGSKRLLNQDESLFFQYWPPSLTDDYQVQYAEHMIPGGSHPLYQWVGGQGRTITFEAVFTAELNTSRISDAAGVNLLSSTATAVAIGSALLPSTPFTVDVAAALAKIRSWMMPKYGPGGRLGETDPPKILTLVFPGTGLGGGGSNSGDMITVILRSAPITFESWFPNGQPRVATVTLTFNEIAQTPSGSGNNKSTKVQFLDRKRFEKAGDRYRNRGLSDRPFIGG